LKEDYDTGIRQAQVTTKGNMQEYFGDIFPDEMRTLVGGLSRRGLLSEGKGLTQPQQKYDLPEGGQLKQVQPTRQTFGGIAGKRIGMLTSSQQARQEAQERALRDRSKELGQVKARGVTDLETQSERTKWQTQQEIDREAQQLGTQYWQRALSGQAYKQKLIDEPYTT